MKEVQFQELKVDDKFTINGKEYKRISDQRVSCCKVFNAVSCDNPAEKIQIKPLTTTVQIND